MSLLAIVPYPRGFWLTRQQNTWSCLHLKWIALRLHSPVGEVGVRLLHFLFPCFPTKPRKSTLCPGRKTLETKHYLSVQFQLTGSQHARRIILQVAGFTATCTWRSCLPFTLVFPPAGTSTAALQMVKHTEQPFTGLLLYSRGWLQSHVTTSSCVSQKQARQQWLVSGDVFVLCHMAVWGSAGIQKFYSGSYTAVTLMSNREEATVFVMKVTFSLKG